MAACGEFESSHSIVLRDVRQLLFAASVTTGTA